MVDDGFKHGVNAHARLGGYGQRLGAVEADAFFNIGLDALDLGAGQVYLVENRQHFMVVIKGKVYVGQSLRFHALGCVNHQQRAFAGGQGA